LKMKYFLKVFGSTTIIFWLYNRMILAVLCIDLNVDFDMSHESLTR